MKTMAAWYTAGCALFVVVLSGCSGASPNISTVAGTVTLDGQPLKSGTIRFDATDGRTAAADASIADGKYTAKLPPGEKRVAITAPKVIGKKKMYDTPDSPTFDVTEESLPKRYNAQTELKLTVTSGAQDAPPFELKSK